MPRKHLACLSTRSLALGVLLMLQPAVGAHAQDGVRLALEAARAQSQGNLDQSLTLLGEALAEAHKAVTGDISGVTEGLGVAFNSTLVALLLSLVLMFLLHGLQLAQERLALDAETYLDNRLLRNLQVR